MVSALLQRSEIIKRSRQEKWRRRLMRFLLWLAILALALAELSWFLHREAFLFQKVEIVGATPGLSARVQTVIRDQLSGDYLGLIPRSGIWFYPKIFLIKSLTTSLPEISEIKINLVAGHVLLISIKERSASYLWCGQDGATCYTLDETGLAFALAPRFSGYPFFQFSGELPAVPIGSRPLPPDIFSQVIALQSGINKVLASSVLPLRIYLLPLEQPLEWHFLLHNPDLAEDSRYNVTLLVDNRQALGNLLINLHSALSAPVFIQEYQDKISTGATLDYLDLRFPDKVFYKFK